MFTPAFSTVACPEWTLHRVASAAKAYGYGGVELRSFGPASKFLACDPALSDEAKTRRTFAARGMEVASLATSIRFDERINPPVVGMFLGDQERSVREAKRAVDLAVALECPLVRVFAFQVPPREKPASARARIVRRLRAVLDHAHNTGVRLVLENGGSFPAGADIAAIIDEVGSPLLGGCYSLAPAAAVGESPREGVGALGERLWLARIKDLRDGRPCRLGTGELPAQSLVRTLVESGYEGALVYEWDRLWLPELEGADGVLPGALDSMLAWAADARPGRGPVVGGSVMGARATAGR